MLTACSLSPIFSSLSGSDTATDPQVTESTTSETAEAEPDRDLKGIQVTALQAAPVVPPEPTSLPAQIIAEADAEELLLINIYERVNPSVVNVVVTVDNVANSNNFSDLFPNQGQGSGFVVDRRGYIVTNNHVVEEADEVSVTFYDGTIVEAEVVGADRDSDLAVLRVEVPEESLRPIVWGDSDELKVGQRAIAIGNPFGLDGTLTSGIISALGRSLPTENGQFRIPEIIQTDAAINPGNSGGPLLNSQGEVVGVNTAIVPRREGLGGERSFLGVGFAVPANLVKRVVPSLIENGKYQHPWIGFSGNSVTPEIAKEMNLSQATGALVVQVLSGSPADQAGLRGGTREIVFDNGLDTTIGGDVIIAIEDEVIHTFDDLISFLSRRGVVGETVTLTIIRDGKEQTVDLILGPRPESGEIN
jgi:2-alkenal reductase